MPVKDERAEWGRRESPPGSSTFTIDHERAAAYTKDAEGRVIDRGSVWAQRRIVWLWRWRIVLSLARGMWFALVVIAGGLAGALLGRIPWRAAVALFLASTFLNVLWWAYPGKRRTPVASQMLDVAWINYDRELRRLNEMTQPDHSGKWWSKEG